MTNDAEGPVDDPGGIFSGGRSDSPSRSGSADGPSLLRGMRVIFGALVAGVVLFAIVIVVTGPSTSADDRQALPAAVVAGIIAVLFVAQLVVARFEKPLDCSEPRRLASSYQSRMIIRLAVAELAALFGVVAYFLSGTWWQLIAGLAVAAFGFIGAAPTTAAIEDEQERLQARGCPHSLLDELRRSGPPVRR